MKKVPELLAPAGGLEQLSYAVHYGADAVYMAGSKYGLRVRAKNFEDENLARAIAYAHEHGIKVFVTANAIMHEDDVHDLPAYLEQLDEMGADAIIANDLATIKLIKKYAPNCAIHASTQCSITNSVSAEIYHELGAKRVVLARELSLAEIAKIREEIPDSLELEVFVHGSMCMAYSGRCIISNRLTGRDANKGHCAQPCRWKYALVEEKRPGQYIPIEEDERGSYIMNSEDLMMLPYLNELKEIGIDCLKVEGRIKSAYYVGTVINAYRSVLDGAPADKFLPELDAVSHRPYSTGFYFDTAKQETEIDGSIATCEWAAKVVSCEEVTAQEFETLPLIYQNLAEEMGEGPYYKVTVDQKNRFERGGTIEVVKKGDVGIPVTVYGLLDARGQQLKAVDVANVTHVRYIFYTTTPINEFDIIRVQRDKKS